MRKTSMHPLISMLAMFATLTVVLGVFLLPTGTTGRIAAERREGSGCGVDRLAVHAWPDVRQPPVCRCQRLSTGAAVVPHLPLVSTS